MGPRKQSVWDAYSLNYDVLCLSAALSSMAWMPLCIRCSLDSEELRHIAAIDPLSNRNIDFGFPFWSTIAGAIAGAYLLPLDWFVPYQYFPIPCVIGAVCGHAVAFFAIVFLAMCCPGV